MLLFRLLYRRSSGFIERAGARTRFLCANSTFHNYSEVFRGFIERNEKKTRTLLPSPLSVDRMPPVLGKPTKTSTDTKECGRLSFCQRISQFDDRMYKNRVIFSALELDIYLNFNILLYFIRLRHKKTFRRTTSISLLSNKIWTFRAQF